MPESATSPLNIYETFMQEASILFLVLTHDGVIKKANAFAKRQIGKDIEHKPFESIILDFYNTFDLSEVMNTASSPYPLNIKRDNGLPQTYRFRFEPSENRIYAFGEVDNDELEDVRKEILSLNEELNNLTRELHKKNSLLELLNQEKNQFLGMAAHDLRKPIGLVITYSDFLLDEAAQNLNEEHVRFLNTIQKSCLFMKRLVDDFLDVSAIEAGKFELDIHPGYLSDALEQCLRLNNLQADKKGVRLDVNTQGNLPRILMDKPKIEQAITNLVSNAIEHTFPDTLVRIDLTSYNGAVNFCVEDKGPGIAPEELNRLFKPFEKTSTKKTGGEKSTGLGMLITRKIIEAHEGKIWVKSALGKGTRVFFSLPLKRSLP